ncbi:lysophospholipid acyltransferase family protein [Nakamurella sp. GG22]
MRWFHLGGADDPTPEASGPKGMDRGRRIGITLGVLMYRMRVAGMSRVPATGPVVFVANHQNFMDGALLFGALPRRVSFLVKAEAVKGPLGWLLVNVGQHAVVRGVPDREPLLRALAQLQAGGAIGIFPEGTRGAGNVESVFPGAGWLAARSGATVVPVAIRGTDRPAGRKRRRFRPEVHVLVGEAFAVQQGGGRKAVAAATEDIRTHLAALVATLDAEIVTGPASLQRTTT